MLTALPVTHRRADDARAAGKPSSSNSAIRRFMNRSPGFRQTVARHLAREIQMLASHIHIAFEPHRQNIQLGRNSHEALREGVVDLACQARGLFENYGEAIVDSLQSQPIGAVRRTHEAGRTQPQKPSAFKNLGSTSKANALSLAPPSIVARTTKR
jgi:hypothetical protein